MSESKDEKWVFIKNTNNKYQVSNIGRVKSLFFNKEKILSTAKTIHGYVFAGLQVNKKQVLIRIHRLLATEFIPNPDNKPFVNHINGIRDDNRLDNLEWVTVEENISHGSIRNGNKSSKYIGVSWCNKVKKWRAFSSINSKSKNLGTFNTEEEAFEAYKKQLKSRNLTNKYANVKN